MTQRPAEPLRIALLHHGYGVSAGSDAAKVVGELADGLRAAGHRPCVLTSHHGLTRRFTEDEVPVVQVGRLPEGMMYRRGFAGPLTHVPLTVRALVGAGYDVAHAFSPQDALAGTLWRRLVGRPTVFTCLETLTRDRLADRRLRLWLLRHAVEGSDMVIAPSVEGGEALWRWMALDAPVIDPRDAGAHERAYRRLMAHRSGS